MHVGRIASHLNKRADAETVAPSAIRARGQIVTAAGMADFDQPRELLLAEIPGVIEEFAAASRNAIAAGFDGVELHCTSGYLPAQFLSSGTNLRQDRYGGGPQARIRFIVETLEAMCGAVGADRVGFRICPGNPFNDIHDDAPVETYGCLLAAAAPLGLAYLHLIDVPNPQVDSLALARKAWTGNLILNEGMTRPRAERLLRDGWPQPSPSGGRLSPIPIWCTGCGTICHWRISIPQRSTRRGPKATPTMRRWNRRPV